MMKTSKKIFAKSLVCALAVFTSANMVACGGGKTADDKDTLEIFIGNFGYGYEWLDEEIKLFQEQAWVKEKYPNLSIPTPSHNSETNYAGEKIITDGRTNTVDLFFSCQSASAYFDKKDSGGNAFFEDLSSVFESTIPGESQTMKDKMLPEFLEYQYKETKEGNKVIYSFPWVNGYMGLLYNETLVKQNFGEDYSMPRTTKELESFAAQIKGKNQVPFISATKVNYWNQICATWWAQYEGLDNYINFWNGVNEDDELTSDIFKQKGRLRSLEVLESLISEPKGYNHDEVNTMEFTQAQSKFLLGEGYMMPNGDWFENEMRANAEEGSMQYDITYMKLPVISSIVEKCPSIQGDEGLSALVQLIDEGKTYAQIVELANAKLVGLTEKDYNTVKQARRMMYAVEGHEAYIPSYSTSKEAAKDFLLFLSSDVGIECFMKTLNGVSTAFQYDVEQKANSVYSQLGSLQKSKLEMMKTSLSIPSGSQFKLGYYGGLTYYYKTSKIEVAFASQSQYDRKTAQQIYQDDIDYYTLNGGVNWDTMLINAGMKV